MDTNIPPLTHHDIDIKTWTGLSSYLKGIDYYGKGAIYGASLQGQTLKARCRGSWDDSYQLQVTFGQTGIVSADCTCPVGSGDRCKHVAALLLTWFASPGSIQGTDDMIEALEERSKEELIAIIHLMLEREPHLAVLLKMPIPGSKKGEKPLDEQLIRRQVEQAFQGLGDYWKRGRDSYDVARELQPLLNLARHYHQQNSYSNAAIIFLQVVETVLNYKNFILEDSSEWSGSVIEDCVNGLDNCLESITNAAQRGKILKALFDILSWDTAAGGIGFGDRAWDILLEQTTQQERQVVARWAEEGLTGLSDWARSAMGGLILELRADTLDDESYLEICGQTGRLKDLVDRLLQMQQVDQAVAETHQASDYDLLGLADLFVLHMQGSLAEILISERAKTSQDSRLTRWLKEYAKKQGNLAQALSFAEWLFWKRPELTDFQEMQQLAQSLDQWPDLRRRTLQILAQKGEHRLLTRIYLTESNIDLAIEALNQAMMTSRYWGDFALQEEVARAASQEKPKEAARLYVQLAEQHIR